MYLPHQLLGAAHHGPRVRHRVPSESLLLAGSSAARRRWPPPRRPWPAGAAAPGAPAAGGPAADAGGCAGDDVAGDGGRRAAPLPHICAPSLAGFNGLTRARPAPSRPARAPPTPRLTRAMAGGCAAAPGPRADPAHSEQGPVYPPPHGSPGWFTAQHPS